MAVKTVPYKILSVGVSDIGEVRQNNEDVFELLPEECCYIIADGMGGHQAGEIAAKETTKILAQMIKLANGNHVFESKPTKEIREWFREAIIEINRRIFVMGNSSESLYGMGTTLCSLYFNGECVIQAHVGDSRIYRLRNNQLKQLTKDHSLLRELIDLGQIDEEQTEYFMYKNILTKAIGTEPTVRPSVHVGDVHLHDLFLLCTDGLTDLLTKEEIQNTLLEHSTSLITCAQKLVDKAKANGGHDNITVVLVYIQKLL